MITLVLFMFSNINLSEASITEGLFIYYPFDGNALDVTGNGYDGLVNGAVLANDRFGTPDSAYFFDGVDDYIENSRFTTSSLSAISVAFWINTSQLSNSRIAHTAYGGFYHTSSGQVTWFIDGSSSNNPYVGNINDGLWHFIVGTNDGSISYLYIDGILKSSVTEGIMLGDTLTIGNDRGRNVPFEGIIDDFRVYNRALSQNEVIQLYTVPVPGAIWLLGSGFVGFIGWEVKQKRQATA